MTKIAIEPNASGSGTFTITSPNSNDNRTLTLPDEAGELLTDQRLASEAEAEAGTDNTKLMTPLRTAQAIAELSPQLTQTQAEDPTSTVFGTVSGQRLAQAVAANTGFSKSYVSPEQTIVPGGLLTLAHGFGEPPTLVTAFLICKVSQHGYPVGAVVPYPAQARAAGTGDRAWTASVNATNVQVRYNNIATTFSVINFSTGAGGLVITNTNWRFVVRAWA